MNKADYEKDLEKRQAEHLARVNQLQEQASPPCLHDSCPDCIGTGIKLDGSHCVHGISCPCSKCSPMCATGLDEAPWRYAYLSDWAILSNIQTAAEIEQWAENLSTELSQLTD